MATVVDVLGSRLKAWYANGYSSATGNWTDGTGTGSTFAQATAGKRPAQDALTLPSGNMLLAFDGTNDVLANASGISGLPAYGGQYMYGFVAARSTPLLNAFEWLVYNTTEDDESLFNFQRLYHFGAQANTTTSDTAPRRVVFVGTATGGNVKCYVDGVLQTTQGSGPLGQGWGSAMYVGGHAPTPTDPFRGKIGHLFFAQTATTFSAGDIADVFTVMNTWMVGVVATTYTYLITDTADDRVDGRRLLNQVIAAGLATCTLVESGDGNIYVSFSAPLLSASLTTLAGVIAAHTGAPVSNAIDPANGTAAGVTSAPTTTSATFVVVPEMTVTMTTAGGFVDVDFGCTFNLVAADSFDLQVFVDGVAIASSLRNVTFSPVADILATMQLPVAIQASTASLSAASHVFDVRWRRLAGTARARGVERSLSAIEVLL